VASASALSCCSVLRVYYVFVYGRGRHTSGYRDWSSDVCSSDLIIPGVNDAAVRPGGRQLGGIVDARDDRREHVRLEPARVEQVEIGRACVGKEGRDRWREHDVRREIDHGTR